MKCPKCNGRGYYEVNLGLLNVKCDECDDGEIPDPETVETDEDDSEDEEEPVTVHADPGSTVEEPEAKHTWPKRKRRKRGK